MQPLRRAAAIALACALACARAPASATDVAQLYLERLAAGDLAAAAALCTPAFLARSDASGRVWPAPQSAVRQRLGAAQAFDLQTQRTMPAPDGATRVELTYRVRYAGAKLLERVTVRLPAGRAEPLAISDHTIDAPLPGGGPA